jgi:DNA polymerase-3 subunit delta
VAAATFQSLLKDIRAKKFAPVYVLDGEESYFIDKICEALEEHVLTEAEKDFNLSILYGKDAIWDEVVTACRRFPMFAEKQLVILREAQLMRDFDKLELYWENPSETTVFCIAHKHGKVDKRKTAIKKLVEKHLNYTSDLIKEEKLPDWIIELGKTIQLNISPVVALLLANTLGSDLTKIENELSKVKLNKGEDAVLTEKDVEQFIGTSIEYAIFKLPEAIIARDKKKVYRMLNYFVKNPNDAPSPLVSVTFYNAYSRMYAIQSMGGASPQQIAANLKMSPYFVQQSIVQSRKFSKDQLEKALLSIGSYSKKGVGFGSKAGSGELLKELVFELMAL